MATCGIAFGGNIGNSPGIFETALDCLRSESLCVSRVSAQIPTRAMGADAGGDFINAAAVIETDLEPRRLLNLLHQVESDCGRTRDFHWGPRSLDLDLLFHEDTVLCTSEIVIPHPAMWYRRFVLQPLHEIAADYRHPILQETIADLYARIQRRPLKFSIVGDGLTEIQIDELQQQIDQTVGPGTEFEIRNSEADGSVFAKIIVDSSLRPHASQPPHELGRIIRVAAASDTLLPDICQSLTDISAAALG